MSDPRPARLPPAAPRSTLRRRAALLRHPGCVARWTQGRAVRRRYAARLDDIVTRAPVAPGTRAIAMASFSSRHDLPEQVASITSFLRHAGRPIRWTVVSDGSHQPQDVALLERLEGVRVRRWDDVAHDAPAPVAAFAARHPLGKKLAVLTSLPLGEPTMMVDSDVLFGPGAPTLDREIAGLEDAPRFQLDCYDVLSGEIVGDDEREHPTNTGVVMLAAPLRWERAVAALAGVPLGDRVPGAWLEQGAVHLAMRDSGGHHLDPERFVIRGDDALRLRTAPLASDAVLRHYAGATRHLMWCRVGGPGGRP